MYLLCQDDVHHADGTTTTNLPLTVGVGEAASAFVAFGSPQTARAFLRRFPMGQGYRVLHLLQVPRAKLYVTDLVFLMKKAADVDALVREGTGPHLRDRLLRLTDLLQPDAGAGVERRPTAEGSTASPR